MHSPMLRIVMDTNALVAARWKRNGSAARLMALCTAGVCRPLVSIDVIRENLSILRKVRPSPRFWTSVHAFIAAAELVTDLPDVRVEEDPSDSVFLACALGGGADYLVSTDRHLRACDGCGNLRIGPAARVFEDHPELEVREMPSTCGNLTEDLPDAHGGEVADPLIRSPHLRVERIVSHGQASPPDFWYDQPHDEWVLVLRGLGAVRIEGEEQDRVLRPGDFLHLPAGTRHRVTRTAPGEPTIWLALHFPSAPEA